MSSEHLPGTFRGGDEDEGEQLIPEETSAVGRMKSKADAISAKLTSERIERTLPSEGLKKAFTSIKAATGSIHNLAVLSKQENVLEIREKGLLDQKILKTAPLLYVASGTDIEYPLTLGAREVIMLDPIFATRRFVETLKDRIKVLCGSEVAEEPTGVFRFPFDFGEGAEEVVVRVDPREYGDKTEEARDHLGNPRNLFTPPAKIGMFLVFQGTDPTVDTESMDRLVPGGYILSNRGLEAYTKELFDAEHRSQFFAAPDSERRSMVDDAYLQHGFTSVPFDARDDFSETFVRKVKA